MLRMGVGWVSDGCQMGARFVPDGSSMGVSNTPNDMSNESVTECVRLDLVSGMHWTGLHRLLDRTTSKVLYNGCCLHARMNPTVALNRNAQATGQD